MIVTILPSNICVDKTGTLTRNRMIVELFVAAGERQDALPRTDAKTPWSELGRALALSNDVAEMDGQPAGEPTELALFKAAQGSGYDKVSLQQALPRLAALPFDSERKEMTTLHRSSEGVVAYIKGAPEQVLRQCINVLGDDGAMPFEPDDVLAEAEQLANEGYRVLALATRVFTGVPENLAPDTVEKELTFLGLVAPFLGLPIPLLPIHILWINLVTDGLPGLAFTAEPAEPGIMRRAPRPPDESIFAHGMWQHIVWVGLFVGGISIASLAWAVSRGVEYWQTVVFTVLTVSQLFHSLAVRSETASLFTIGLFSNLPMLGAVVLTVLLQMAVIYVPALNSVFHTQPLPMFDLAVCLLLSSLVLFAVEIEKWLVRHDLIYKNN